MAMICQVCNHDDRLEIDRLLVQGKSHTKIAKKYGLNNQAIRRHALEHLSHQLVSAWQKKDAFQNLDLLGEIEELVRRTKDILTKAEADEKYSLALGAIREARGSYELLSKIAFTLHQAKMTELQLEQEQTRHVHADVAQERLARLSSPELHLLRMLVSRMDDDGGLPDPILDEQGLSHAAIEVLGRRIPGLATQKAGAEKKRPLGKKPPQGDMECPEGFKFGVDFDEHDECDNCEFGHPQAYAACGEDGDEDEDEQHERED